MATTTTNNGWDIPQSTDLVKNGATAIATLGQDIDTSVGTGLLAWTAYTPTWTNLTVGNGTTSAYYVQLGKTVHVRIRFTFGSTSVMGTNPIATLPVTASSTMPTDTFWQGSHQYDASTGAHYYGAMNIVSTTTVRPVAIAASGNYTQTAAINNTTVPFGAAWATGDIVSLAFTYQAA